MVINMDIMLERILELKGDAHGSTKKLADFLGIPGNSVTNWKNGTSKSYRTYWEPPGFPDGFSFSPTRILLCLLRPRCLAAAVKMRKYSLTLAWRYRSKAAAMLFGSVPT